jgi:hypothetical protein
VHLAGADLQLDAVERADAGKVLTTPVSLQDASVDWS